VAHQLASKVPSLAQAAQAVVVLVHLTEMEL
jgi:hypothetical protein